MTTTERISTHLDKLGISDRAELPVSSFPLTLYLRRHQIDAKYALDAKRGRVVTVPQAHAPTALALMELWLEDGSDPVRDGLICLRKWGREEGADG